VTVSASVNPNSSEIGANAWVQYGPYTNYGQATAPQGLFAGLAYTNLNASLSNLAPGLAWHYRWVAYNYDGTNFSTDQSVSVGPQLYTQGFTDGQSSVTNSPNTYNLYTFTQYTNKGATNFSAGRAAGRSDVTNSPNNYGLYTSSQLQALNVNSPLLEKNPTNGMFTLTIGVQVAPQLTNFAAFPMNSPGFTTTINAAGNLDFNFTSTNDAAFFRLQSQ
jgi:hypothetical protein